VPGHPFWRKTLRPAAFFDDFREPSTAEETAHENTTLTALSSQSAPNPRNHWKITRVRRGRPSLSVHFYTILPGTLVATQVHHGYIIVIDREDNPMADDFDEQLSKFFADRRQEKEQRKALLETSDAKRKVELDAFRKQITTDIRPKLKKVAAQLEQEEGENNCRIEHLDEHAPDPTDPNITLHVITRSSSITFAFSGIQITLNGRKVDQHSPQDLRDILALVNNEPPAQRTNRVILEFLKRLVKIPRW